MSGVDEEAEMLRAAIANLCEQRFTVAEIAKKLGKSQRLVRELGGDLPLVRGDRDRNALFRRMQGAERRMRHIDDEDVQHLREAHAGGMSVLELAAYYAISTVAVCFALRGDLYGLAKGPKDVRVELPPVTKYWRPDNEKHRRVLKERLRECRQKYLNQVK